MQLGCVAIIADVCSYKTHYIQVCTGGCASALKQAARQVEDVAANRAQYLEAAEEAKMLPVKQTKLCQTRSTQSSPACGAQLPTTASVNKTNVCKYCHKLRSLANAVKRLDKKRKAELQEG